MDVVVVVVGVDVVVIKRWRTTHCGQEMSRAAGPHAKQFLSKAEQNDNAPGCTAKLRSASTVRVLN